MKNEWRIPARRGSAITMRRLVLAATFLLCVGALTALAVLLVENEADRTQAVLFAEAESATQSATTSMLLLVRKALLVTRVAAELIQTTPSQQGVESPATATLLNNLLKEVPTAGAAFSLHAVYAGRVLITYSNGTAGNHQQSMMNLSVGQILSLRPTGFDTQFLTVAELQSPSGQPNPVIILLPVYVKALSASDSWGWPANTSATECQTEAGLATEPSTAPGQLADFCFNQTTGLKWWGYVVLSIHKDQLGTLADETSRSSSYGCTLSILGQSPTSMPSELSAHEPVVLYTSLTASTQCQSRTATHQGRLAPGLQVEVVTCVVDGWSVPWEVPVIVVVVVVPVALAIILIAVLLNWMRHSEVLHTLLPKSTIEHLVRTHASYPESTTSVTGSPSEKLIAILGQFLSGQSPRSKDVMEVLLALQQGVDLYMPTNLQDSLVQAVGEEGEVAQALMRALLPDMSSVAGPSSLSEYQSIATSRHGTSAAVLEEMQYDTLAQALQSITEIDVKSGADRTARAENDQSQSFSFDIDFTTPGKFVLSSFSEVHEDEELLTYNTETLSLTSKNPVITRLEQVLMNSRSLDGTFNSWELEQVSRNHPLSALAYWCFYDSRLIDDLQLSGRKLAKFLQTVESGYLDNPYHNRTHAADVLQSVHALVHTTGLKCSHLDNVDVLACYLAAVVHDYNHQGVTNDFIINTGHELAVRYNDSSPHENHHVSAGLALLNDPECDFLDAFSKVERHRLRKLVIELVLATDMKRHFGLIALFNSNHSLQRLQPGNHGTSLDIMGATRAGHYGMVGHNLTRASSMRKANSKEKLGEPSAAVSRLPPRSGSGNNILGSTSLFGGPAAAHTIVTLDVVSSKVRSNHTVSSPANVVLETQPLSESEKLLTMQMLLKCADLGHTCASLAVHLRWVAALQAEMFIQGDQERSLALPMSPLCNREGMGITQSQVGFYEVVVLPMLKAFTSRYPSAMPIMRAANANYQYWRERQAV